jgi:tetratricopeptide (TPR) repeat protein
MLERFGRDDDAIRYYEDARRIDPNSTFVLKRLADLYKRTGRLEQTQATAGSLDGLTANVAAGR